MTTAAARETVEKVLSESGMTFARKVEMTRGEKGRITGSKTRYVLEGKFLENAFSKNYFLRSRVKPLQAAGLNVILTRRDRKTGEVALVLAA